MGVYLDELLAEIKKSSLDEQVRIICDKIQKEEVVSMKNYPGPTGPNIFLSLEAYRDEKTHDLHFVCLERESAGLFIVSHWSRGQKPNSPLKRLKVWQANEGTAQKVLKTFAQQLMFVKGE